MFEDIKITLGQNRRVNELISNINTQKYKDSKKTANKTDSDL